MEETLSKIAHCCTVDAILEQLDQTDCRPEFFIKSVLDSIRRFGMIPNWKTEMLERYYSLLLQIFTEVHERGQFLQFATARMCL